LIGNMEINIRIRSDSNKTVQLAVAGDILYGDFFRKISEAFDLGSSGGWDLLGGFPPTRIELDNDASISGHIGNNETLRLKKGNTVQAAFSPASSPAAPSSSSKRTTKGKLSAFDKSVKEAVKAAEKAKKQGVKGGVVVNSSSSFGARIATLTPSSSSSASRTKQATNQDAKEKETNKSVGAKRGRVTKMTMGSEDDVSFQLLAAVDGGTGKKNKFLRAVYRRAVELQYDQSKAEARVMALVSGKYQIVESGAARTLGTGDCAKMVVQFSKGLNSRVNHEDKVDLLTREQLKATIGLILASSNTRPRSDGDDDGDGDVDDGFDPNAKEMLKPVNMAGCSPRVFWSLVRLFGPDIKHGLEQLFPPEQGHDWSWLKGRMKTLSEKAIANLEQEQEEQELKEATKRSRRDISTSSNGDTSFSSSQPAGGMESPHQVDVLGAKGMALYTFLDTLPLQFVDITLFAGRNLHQYYRVNALSMLRTVVDATHNKDKIGLQAISALTAVPEPSDMSSKIKLLCPSEDVWIDWVDAARGLIISIVWHIAISGIISIRPFPVPISSLSRLVRDQEIVSRRQGTIKKGKLLTQMFSKRLHEPRYLAMWKGHSSGLLNMLMDDTSSTSLELNSIGLDKAAQLCAQLRACGTAWVDGTAEELTELTLDKEEKEEDDEEDVEDEDEDENYISDICSTIHTIVADNIGIRVWVHDKNEDANESEEAGFAVICGFVPPSSTSSVIYQAEFVGQDGNSRDLNDEELLKGIKDAKTKLSNIERIELV